MTTLIWLSACLIFLAAPISAANYAASFPGGGNGTASNIALPGANLSTSTPFAFTFEAWIYPTLSGFEDYGSLFYSRANSATGVFIRLPGCSSCCSYNTNYELRSVYGNEDSGSTTCTNISIAFNTWQHVALVVNATTQVLYWNLQEAFVYPAYPFIENDFSGIGYLGWDPALIGRTYSGLLDEVRFWNISRQISDIAATYLTELSLPQAGLLAYYTFDDQNPSGVTDNSGHGLTGQLNGVNYTFATGLSLQPAPTSSSSSAAHVLVSSTAAATTSVASSSAILSTAARSTAAAPSTAVPSTPAPVVTSTSAAASSTTGYITSSTEPTPTVGNAARARASAAFTLLGTLLAGLSLCYALTL